MKTSTLFLDIKGAFDHVSKNQLLKICLDLGLPISLLKWIHSFLSNREMALAFDRETSQVLPIEVGIPQGSPISPILFLIYTRVLFDSNKEPEARYLSYIDDNSITISSKSHELNCRKLELICNNMIQKGLENHIIFDHDKTELIHYFPSRAIDLDSPRNKVILGDTEIKAQNIVKWLGIYIDSRLTFKDHIIKKTEAANRVFHQIARLSNTERGLSFQAMRQLYIACVCSIADYGVPIWWAGQQSLLDKYQKLQNQALLKILGAFRGSTIRAMEIEASLLPPRARLNKICRSYVLRTIDFN